jgi:hypothetical protein
MSWPTVNFPHCLRPGSGKALSGATPTSTSETSCSRSPYVAVLGPADPRAFLARSVGGHFKGRDPTVPLAALESRVVPDAEALYIGKTNSLRRRIGEYADYGRGKPVGHRGGRLIWQLRDHRKLLIAWLAHDHPEALEAELVSEFVDAYGTLPFANLLQPGLRAAA